MAARPSITTVVRWFPRLHGLVPGWIGAILLVGSLGGPAQAASLNPGDILIVGQTATDDGPIGIVFAANPANGDQTPVAVGGSLVEPVGVAIGLDTNLYVVDPICCGSSGTLPGVIRVDFVTGEQSVISSGGHLVNPVGITFWEAGILGRPTATRRTCAAGAMPRARRRRRASVADPTARVGPAGARYPRATSTVEHRCARR
jgi:hypothetical protein